MKRLDIPTFGAVTALAMQGCAEPRPLTWDEMSAEQCLEHYEDQDYEYQDGSHRLTIADAYAVPQEPEDGQVVSDLLVRFEMRSALGDILNEEECRGAVDSGVRAMLSEATDNEYQDHYWLADKDFCEQGYYNVLTSFEIPEDYYGTHKIWVEAFWQCRSQLKIGAGFEATVLINEDGEVQNFYYGD
jgi:hypothetical protein